MDKLEVEFLLKVYSPAITKIIKDNVKFYRFSETIKWHFCCLEDISIFANCDRKTKNISINLNAVYDSYLNNDKNTIEYFILHEIRHIFQNLMIKDYIKGKYIPIESEIVKKWKYESENYITSCNSEGNENSKYFMQDCEMDAYAFSLAVMKYKYDDISSLYVPPIYGIEFYKIVDSWIKTF